MPGPYSFPTDRVTGGPAPAADYNALAAALNEATNEQTPSTLVLRDADGNFKSDPPVSNEDVVPKGWTIDKINELIGYIEMPAAGPGEYVGVDGGGVAARWNTLPISLSNVSLGSSTMKVSPMPIYGPCRLRSFTFQVTTAGDAGSLIHWWLYKPSGAKGSIPDTLVQAFAGVSGAATGQVTITAAEPIPLDPGYYMMLVGQSNVTTTAPGVQSSNSTMSQELAYRTRNGNRMDLFVRGGTDAVGIGTGSPAPATIDWNFSATSPHLIDVSGGRMPMMLLDLIPAI